MTEARVTIGRRDISVAVDDRVVTMPVGVVALLEGELVHDPPRPEELTNAIGVVHDHLDDVIRELPGIVGADVSVLGAEAVAIAAVEVGASPVLPFVLSRDAAEDVFRTLATEASEERRLNPGLPAALVGTVVAGCCALVSVMRRLQLDEVTVRA